MATKKNTQVKPPVEVENDEIEGQAEDVGKLVPVAVGSKSEVGGNTYEVAEIIKKGTSFYITIFRVGAEKDEDGDIVTQEVRVGSKTWAKLFPNGSIDIKTKVVEKAKKAPVFVDDDVPEFPDEDFDFPEIVDCIEKCNSVKSEAVRVALYASAMHNSPLMLLVLNTVMYRAELPYELEKFESLVLVDKVQVKRPAKLDVEGLTNLLADMLSRGDEQDLGDEDYLKVLRMVPESGQGLILAMISNNGWNILERPKISAKALEALKKGYTGYKFDEVAE